MKINKLFVVVLLLLTACKCNNGNDKSLQHDSILVIPDTLLVYDVDTENKTLKKHSEVPDSSFTAVRVVNGLNDKYPNVQISLLSVRNDTIYIHVPQSEYLGERMGSAGAEAWYTDVVLNLTALKGINYVNINLEEGSHVQPGVFNKADYPGFRIDTLAH
jgi:hypothetical protein